jgi:thiol-disulfide isomerase/thioredoxin
MNALMLLLAAALSVAALIPDVRSAVGRGDYAAADQLISAYRAERGVTPEMLEALSWIARGALGRKDYNKSEKYAAETHQLSLAELKKRPLDQERFLPIALGASIEVRAHTLAANGRRTEAVDYLRGELKTYHATSIRTRIQKNIHLLSLEGKTAPRLEGVALEKLKGQPVLLFFWAHWCGDCKAQGPVLARLNQEYGSKGLKILAPTQRYGYVSRGQDAAPEVEERYIEEVRQKSYAPIANVPAPIHEENFKNWGASTTPTLVLIDRAGTVQLYHPGQMSYEELRPRVEAIVR